MLARLLFASRGRYWDRPDSLERGAQGSVKDPRACQWKKRLRVAVSGVSAVPHSPSTIDERTDVTVSSRIDAHNHLSCWCLRSARLVIILSLARPGMDLFGIKGRLLLFVASYGYDYELIGLGLPSYYSGHHVK